MLRALLIMRSLFSHERRHERRLSSVCLGPYSDVNEYYTMSTNLWMRDITPETYVRVRMSNALTIRTKDVNHCYIMSHNIMSDITPKTYKSSFVCTTSLRTHHTRRRSDLKSLQLPKFPTRFHKSPRTYQTYFRGSPQNFKQGFIWVKITQKGIPEKDNLEIQRF